MTMRAADPKTYDEALERLHFAERVCLLFGWTAVSEPTDRGLATSEAWNEWVALYEADGGTLLPADHPDLSDDAIAELAERRRNTIAETNTAIRRLQEAT